MSKPRHIVLLTTVLAVSVLLLHAADTLPAQLSDDVFWKLVESLSEPSQPFPGGENAVSNELRYSAVVGTLQKTVTPGGAYLGVGPEQNFSYIAALQPKIAFIIDIRRQNLVEHMMYRALFELADDRADFLSRLFSRKKPAALHVNSTAKELMDAYSTVSVTPETVQQNLQDIKTLLVQTHGFRLTNADTSDLEKIFKIFSAFGPNTNYQSTGDKPSTLSQTNPTYATLMTALDPVGHNWSYLATETNYRLVRDMERRNLIVPVVGDFAGPKAIRGIGDYLRERGAVVRVFYLSNVETYLFAGTDGAPNANVRAFAPNGGWKSFFENVATLPVDAASTFVRFQGAAGTGQLNSVEQNLDAFKSGSLQNLSDVYGPSK